MVPDETSALTMNSSPPCKSSCCGCCGRCGRATQHRGITSRIRRTFGTDKRRLEHSERHTQSFSVSSLFHSGPMACRNHLSKQDCGFTDNPEHAVPGPGQYNLDRKETQRLGSGPTSSFRCARKPLENERSCDTPAPGAYELATPVHPRVDKNGQVLKAPFFRSQTKRDASFISGSEVPGPGEYDIDRGMTIAKESSLLPVVAGHAGKRPGGRFGQDDDCQEEASVSPGAQACTLVWMA